MPRDGCGESLTSKSQPEGICLDGIKVITQMSPCVKTQRTACIQKIVNFTVHNFLRKFKSPQKDAKSKDKRVSKLIDDLSSM